MIMFATRDLHFLKLDGSHTLIFLSTSDKISQCAMLDTYTGPGSDMRHSHKKCGRYLSLKLMMCNFQAPVPNFMCMSTANYFAKQIQYLLCSYPRQDRKSTRLN